MQCRIFLIFMLNVCNFLLLCWVSYFLIILMSYILIVMPRDVFSYCCAECRIRLIFMLIVCNFLLLCLVCWVSHILIVMRRYVFSYCCAECLIFKTLQHWVSSFLIVILWCHLILWVVFSYRYSGHMFMWVCCRIFLIVILSVVMLNDSSWPNNWLANSSATVAYLQVVSSIHLGVSLTSKKLSNTVAYYINGYGTC